jgi:DNA-binding response OmpR family regulator
MSVELPALSVAGFEFADQDATTGSRASGVVSLSASGRPEARPGRILVVEDEPTVAQLIADVMTEESHQVDILLDSREALCRLEEKNYTLIICDLKMPQMDGPGLYRALVRRGSPSQHRILFVTGDTMSPRTLEFLKASGLPYLGKPFLVEELKMALRLACEEIAAVTEWPRAATRKK